MMKKAKQVLVIFLAFLMFFQTFEPGLRAIGYARTETEAVGTETGLDLWPDGLEDVASIDDTGAEYGLWPEEIEEEIPELTGDDIMGELYHLREANVKHFRMSDGSMEKALYVEPIHFERDGSWSDIDNRLVLTLDIDREGLRSAHRDSIKEKYQSSPLVYKNMANSFDLSFSKDADQNNMVTLSDGDYRISWSAL